MLGSQYHIFVAFNDSDNDGDGYTDAEEIAAGSDPDDGGSVPSADTTPPALNIPANITVEATAVLTPVSWGVASATDNIDGTVPVNNDAPATFPLGVTTITYTATDAAGNTALATQTVTVVDTTAHTQPMVNSPPNVIPSQEGIHKSQHINMTCLAISWLLHFQTPRPLIISLMDAIAGLAKKSTAF